MNFLPGVVTPNSRKSHLIVIQNCLISRDGPYFFPFPHSGSSYERIRWISLLNDVYCRACDVGFFLGKVCSPIHEINSLLTSLQIAPSSLYAASLKPNGKKSTAHIVLPTFCAASLKPYRKKITKHIALLFPFQFLFMFSLPFLFPSFPLR